MIELNRRTFLTATAGTVIGASALSGPVAAHEPPMAHPILCEVGMDGRFDVENHRVADPATSVDVCEGSDDGETATKRENVLHVTSHGNSTRDYSSGIVNVQDRFDEPLTLADVSDSGAIAFDYFQGPNNANAAPDEVFLIVRKDDRHAGSLAETGFFAVYKTINDGREPDPANTPCEEDNKEWRGLDVSAQLTGGTRQWAAIPIAESDVASGQMVIETAQSLRDQEDRFENVLDRFGSASEVVAVGYGKGNTRQETTVDVYYDNLVVRRDDENVVKLDFPATIPMDVEFRPPRVNTAGGGTLNASLSLRQDEVGIDLADVREDSVKLTPYVPVVPPVEEGATARSVSVSDDGLRAQFRVSAVADVLQSEEQPVLLSGRFDNDAHDAFLAQGTLTVRDPGRSGLSSHFR